MLFSLKLFLFLSPSPSITIISLPRLNCFFQQWTPTTLPRQRSVRWTHLIWLYCTNLLDGKQNDPAHYASKCTLLWRSPNLSEKNHLCAFTLLIKAVPLQREPFNCTPYFNNVSLLMMSHILYWLPCCLITSPPTNNTVVSRASARGPPRRLTGAQGLLDNEQPPLLRLQPRQSVGKIDHGSHSEDPDPPPRSIFPTTGVLVLHLYFQRKTHVLI